MNKDKKLTENSGKNGAGNEIKVKINNVKLVENINLTKITKKVIEVRESRIRFMYTNIRSLMNNNKREEICAIIKEQNIEILGITESWTNENIANSEISLPDFTLYRKDRIIGDRTRGGGVLLYIKNDIISMEENNEDETESIWARIKLDGRVDIVVGVCYRAPGTNLEEGKKLLDRITEIAKNPCIIMGDFNYPDINWELQEAGPGGIAFFD